MKCDLCGNEVLPGEPRRGGVAPPGMERHWACHGEKFGHPARSDPVSVLAEGLRIRDERTASASKPEPARAVLAPNVTKGEYNRSANAVREWRQIGPAIHEMGRKRIRVECPFCFATFWGFVWSLAGGGKRCPNCGAKHTLTGSQAIPLTGNEDM